MVQPHIIRTKPVIKTILRGWGNARVGPQIRALSLSGAVDQIIMAYNVSADPKHDHNKEPLQDTTFTPHLVEQTKQQMKADGIDFPNIVMMPIEAGYNGRFWSKPLNIAGEYALRIGRYANRDTRDELESSHILCLSNEVDFKGAEGIESLVRASSFKNASCGYAQFDCTEGPEEMIGKPIDRLPYLGPRNTDTAWVSEWLIKYHAMTGMMRKQPHLFDEITDEHHGMEDKLTGSSLYSMGYACGPDAARYPVCADVRAGVALSTDPEAVAKKHEGEMKSMQFIAKHFVTPDIERAYWEDIATASGSSFYSADFMQQVEHMLATMPHSFRPGRLSAMAQALTPKAA